ncbi:MAG: hypothetical protein E6J64_02255 [Deltaproteobacteria bacterium]|nr:MAG: hypothetical protein E6J64_02255 [Deltaproteobacteria bacterium]
MTRAGVAIAAGFLAAACYGHDRPVGTQPTPLSVQGAAAKDQVRATPERENMRVQGPHSEAADSSESAKNGKTCATDADCSGRLRCVAYHGVAGREVRQCLFPCTDGCPTGFTCQMQVADGPRNTCASTR